MVKKLTWVGNSQALILPASLVKRYNLTTVVLEETEEGILIRPSKVKSSFEKKLAQARRNRKALYQQMEKDARDPGTLAFYDDTNNTFDDVDPEIID